MARVLLNRALREPPPPGPPGSMPGSAGDPREPPPPGPPGSMPGSADEALPRPGAPEDEPPEPAPPIMAGDFVNGDLESFFNRVRDIDPRQTDGELLPLVLQGNQAFVLRARDVLRVRHKYVPMVAWADARVAQVLGEKVRVPPVPFTAGGLRAKELRITWGKPEPEWTNRDDDFGVRPRGCGRGVASARGPGRGRGATDRDRAVDVAGRGHGRGAARGRGADRARAADMAGRGRARGTTGRADRDRAARRDRLLQPPPGPDRGTTAHGRVGRDRAARRDGLLQPPPDPDGDGDMSDTGSVLPSEFTEHFMAMAVEAPAADEAETEPPTEDDELGRAR